MDTLSAILTVENLLKSSPLGENDKTALTKKIDTLRRRCEDPNLYIGIIGEFSSGKSTLLNALFGRDYFVTNSIQGTTTVVTSIKYSDNVNLELKYKDGKVVKYQKDKLNLIKQFLPEKYKDLSLLNQISIKSKDLLGINKLDPLMMEIFEVITTSDEVAKELDEVVLCFPSDFLKEGIVLMDTPGTDSLNPEHEKITAEAIKNKCDIAFIIIPSTKPLSQSLANFISNNLEHCLDNCVFMLTMVELLRESEYNGYLKGVRGILEYTLEVDQPQLVIGPTLLSLESRGIVEPQHCLRRLSNEWKEKLTRMFDEQIGKMFSKLKADKIDLIKNSKSRILHGALEEINTVLADVSSKLLQLRVRKVAEKSIPLNAFLTRHTTKDIFSYGTQALSEMKREFAAVKGELKDHIDDLIWKAQKKNEIQGLMATYEADRLCMDAFSKCYKFVASRHQWLERVFSEFINNLGADFTATYHIAPQKMEIPSQSASIKEKSYKRSFNTWQLTTSVFARPFVNKEKIRKEMLAAVDAHLTETFNKLLSTYQKPITKIDNLLKVNVEKNLKLLSKHHSKDIARMIEVQQGEIDRLSHDISILHNDMKTINDMIGETDRK